MAQAIRNKEIRKNCIDVEKVILECHCEFKTEKIRRKIEPITTKKFNKKLFKYSSKYDADHRKELIPVNQVKQNLVFKNYMVYY